MKKGKQSLQLLIDRDLQTGSFQLWVVYTVRCLREKDMCSSLYNRTCYRLKMKYLHLVILAYNTVYYTKLINRVHALVTLNTQTYVMTQMALISKSVKYHRCREYAYAIARLCAYQSNRYTYSRGEYIGSSHYRRKYLMFTLHQLSYVVSRRKFICMHSQHKSDAFYYFGRTGDAYVHMHTRCSYHRKYRKLDMRVICHYRRQMERVGLHRMIDWTNGRRRKKRMCLMSKYYKLLHHWCIGRFSIREQFQCMISVSYQKLLVRACFRSLHRHIDTIKMHRMYTKYISLQQQQRVFACWHKVYQYKLMEINAVTVLNNTCHRMLLLNYYRRWRVYTTQRYRIDRIQAMSIAFMYWSNAYKATAYYNTMLMLTCYHGWSSILASKRRRRLKLLHKRSITVLLTRIIRKKHVLKLRKALGVWMDRTRITVDS